MSRYENDRNRDELFAFFHLLLLPFRIAKWAIAFMILGSVTWMIYIWNNAGWVFDVGDNSYSARQAMANPPAVNCIMQVDFAHRSPPVDDEHSYQATGLDGRM